MNKLTAVAIENKVDQLFRLRRDHIAEKLFEGCNNTDGFERVYTEGIYNSMIISVDIAVELVIDALMNLGVIGQADEKTVRKSIMSVVETDTQKQQ